MLEPAEELKYCEDYEHLKVDCCFSCHEDWGDYGYPMSWIFDDKTRQEIAHVCCSVANAIKDAEEEEPKKC